MADINGTLLPDILIGTEGDDTITGVGGADILLSGNGGNDTIHGGDGDDLILSGGEGNDVLDGGASSGTLPILGGLLNLDLIALYDGGSGNDLMIASSQALLENFDGGDGVDTVDFSQRNQAIDIDLTRTGFGIIGGLLFDQVIDTENVNGSAFNDVILGNDSANVLRGNAGTDVLEGREGNDALNGGAGIDTMAGGLGDDWFFVDNAGDVVTEALGEGADRIFASANYTLGDGIHVEILSTASNTGTDAINLTGNALVNSIAGNNGSNVLDGKAGADTLNGLGGNDFFYVDNAGDVVIEAASGGNDRVFASVSYTLGDGVHVEILSTASNTGTGAINLTGNALVNSIAGNNGSNVLDGKAGADTLNGLGGNDFFHVDNAGDTVIEAAGGGTDRVLASTSYTLGAEAHVELLSTTSIGGTAAINLTGNHLANLIGGNAGANVLDGGGGADTLAGNGGADTYRFTTALGGGNVDSILGYSVNQGTIQLDDAVFAGLAAGTLAAGAFRSGAAATDADDRIIYNGTTGALLFDADGSGVGAAVQFAILSTGLAMGAGEFVVI